MTGKHAILSPSGAHRWMACPGSVVMEQGRPNRDSKYSAEGTAAHELAASCLISATLNAGFSVGKKAENGVEITEDMATEVQKYVDFVRDLLISYGPEAVLLVEQGLPLEPLTDEEDAEGTGDVVMVTPDELVVIDLKFGMGHQVDAERNKQLMMYALAAWHVWSILQDFKTVRLIVHQPRLNHVSEWSCTVEQLLAFGKQVSDAALACWGQFDKNDTDADLVPGEDQCRWCKASGDCRAQDSMVLKAVAVGEFEDLTATPEVTTTELGIKLDKVHFIQDWCKKVQALGETELRAGNTVVGLEGPYKLVRGRKGSRAWKDAVAVENTLKAMRVKHDLMYDYKIVSPTRAQELAKSGELGPRNWKKLQEYIHQSEGGLSVAKASDKREAVVPESEVFEDLTVDAVE